MHRDRQSPRADIVVKAILLVSTIDLCRSGANYEYKNSSDPLIYFLVMFIVFVYQCTASDVSIDCHNQRVESST